MGLQSIGVLRLPRSAQTIDNSTHIPEIDDIVKGLSLRRIASVSNSSRVLVVMDPFCIFIGDLRPIITYAHLFLPHI